MLGGGGSGAGGGGGGLAAALNSMMQSPEMQALATQLASAGGDGSGRRVLSSVAVEERGPDGDAAMPDAPSADSVAVTSTAGGSGGSGGGQQQPSFAQMMGALMQSPALRQIVDEPEMQRAARRLSGEERCAGSPSCWSGLCCVRPEVAAVLCLTSNAFCCERAVGQPLSSQVKAIAC